jgi:glycosyltransferase involved in cell wall biosynthesis
MRVGIDATCWENRRGFGRFTRNVVPRLVERDVETEYVLYLDDETAASAVLPPRARVRRVHLSEPPSRAAAAGSSRRIRDLLRLSAAVRRDGLDVFVFPSVYTFFPVMGTPTVVGVHDAIVHELPDLTLVTRRERLAWHAKETLALRTAAVVFTVSEASRSAIAAQFRLRPRSLQLVSEAPDPVFWPRSADAIAAARRRIGLPHTEPYVVFAGGVSPHKNIETLLRAYARLHELRSDRPRLVIVGDLETDPFLSSASSVRGQVRALELEESVLLPGYVDDDELAALYTGSKALVIPSLAEGFGLPAVEGAACGATLVLSDLRAHRETLDGAASFFPPTDVAALAAALVEVLDRPEYAADLAARARERAAGLSWEKAAMQLEEIVAAVGRRRRTNPRWD